LYINVLTVKIFCFPAFSSEVIVQIIHTCRHIAVFEAPYYPVDGPIENVFIIMIYTHQDLENEINVIIAGIDGSL